MGRKLKSIIYIIVIYYYVYCLNYVACISIINFKSVKIILIKKGILQYVWDENIINNNKDGGGCGERGPDLLCT